MKLHLFSCMGIIAPGIGFLAPMLWWWAFRYSDFVYLQGLVYLNAFISYSIYGLVCALLCWVYIGFPLLAVLIVIGIRGSLKAASAAYDGGFRDYPPAISFFQTT
jgi:uncharacterized protein